MRGAAETIDLDAMRAEGGEVDILARLDGPRMSAAPPAFDRHAKAGAVRGANLSPNRPDQKI